MPYDDHFEISCKQARLIVFYVMLDNAERQSLVPYTPIGSISHIKLVDNIELEFSFTLSKRLEQLKILIRK